jgi:hypothetical protein
VFGFLTETQCTDVRLELGWLKVTARRLLDFLHDDRLLDLFLHVLVVGLVLETRLALVRVELLRLETSASEKRIQPIGTKSAQTYKKQAFFFKVVTAVFRSGFPPESFLANLVCADLGSKHELQTSGLNFPGTNSQLDISL